jgi:hypothetical protein
VRQLTQSAMEQLLFDLAEFNYVYVRRQDIRPVLFMLPKELKNRVTLYVTPYGDLARIDILPLPRRDDSD